MWIYVVAYLLIGTILHGALYNGRYKDLIAYMLLWPAILVSSWTTIAVIRIKKWLGYENETKTNS